MDTFVAALICNYPLTMAYADCLLELFMDWPQGHCKRQLCT